MARTRSDGSGGANRREGETYNPRDNRDAFIGRLTELVERQSHQIQQLIQQKNANGFSRDVENQRPYQAGPVEIVGERFRKLNPPIFEDAADPVEAEDWLRTVDNMFQYSKVSEEENVLCASFMLRGSAGHWWDTIKCIEGVTTMTWDRFKELFRSKYFTPPIRAMMMNKFIQLRQGDMTVADYIRKFEQLSRFAEHMVSTDALKIDRFLEGLKPEVYRDVCMAGVHGSTYSQVAERALIAEQAELEIRNAVETRHQLV
ncbi:Unknown protein [Striga hermonthica]|uniref:Retrotransposon gag domain-containing protein n=1 Tax=Striga hermonthica TaxID=68872 RepID=A0A9N7N5E1_STRHE|nr:Unknown protein [Striga hermonthica]